MRQPGTAEQPRTAQPRLVIGARVAAVVFVAAAVAYVAWLVVVSGSFATWKRDDWLLIVERSDPSVEAWLRAINGHWSTLLVVTYEAMLRLFGLEHHGPWLAVITAAHVGCAALLGLMVGRRAGPGFGLLAGLAVLAFAQGSEDSLWPFQVAFLGAILFGFAALEIADADRWGTQRAIAVSLLLLGALAWSGVGLVMAVVVGVVLVARRRPWPLVLPSIAYVLWTLAWSTSYADRPGDLPSYVIRVATILGGFAVGPRSPLGAPIILAAAVGIVIALLRGWRPHPLSVAAVLGIAVLYGGVGLRSGFNPDFAEPSRYRYPALVLTLLAASPLVAGGGPTSIRRIVPIAATFAVLIVGIVSLPRHAAGWEHDSLRFLAQAEAVQAYAGVVPASARFEPDGPPVGGYVAAISRWGRPALSSATRQRLTDPVFRAERDAMAARLGAAP